MREHVWRGALSIVRAGAAARANALPYAYRRALSSCAGGIPQRKVCDTMSLFDIQSVTVGPENLTAHVRLANGAPERTSEDIEGTNRVYQLMPQIVEHACVSPAGDTFRDALGDTELAHLLEHVTVELMARVGARELNAGNTAPGAEERTWDITLTCPDDVLTLAALSSAAWIMEWAYAGGAAPAPDVEHTVAGLEALVKGLPSQ